MIKTNRISCIKRGARVYTGSACKNCGGIRRYVSNWLCVTCCKNYNKNLVVSGRKKLSDSEYYYKVRKEFNKLGNVYLNRKLSGIKAKCKRLHIPFSLTCNDIIIPKICPILNIVLKFNKGLGVNDDSPSIDRIIPELGYVKGNVVVISNRANRIKNNSSLKEMKRIVGFYEKLDTRKSI